MNLRKSVAAKILMILSQAATCCALSAAEITQKFSDNRLLDIKIIGKIVEADLSRIESIIKDGLSRSKNRHFHLNVEISSEGGDVHTAIAIGRRIREVNGRVEAIERCFSACVFIYAGGVLRTERPNAGDPDWLTKSIIAIHRPYFSQVPKDVDIKKLPQLRREFEADVRRYFREMNVSERLVEEMHAVPPERLRHLSQEEAERFLPSIDPDYDEQQVLKEARGYGISSAEYRRRKNIADKTCGFSFQSRESSMCQGSVLWGVSRADYDRLSPPVYIECNERYPSSHTVDGLENLLRCINDGLKARFSRPAN
jgi:hypothetical protein